MAQGDFIPRSDTLYQDWLGNFLTVANANLANLGLATTDVTPLQTDKTNFDNAITAAEAASASAKAATEKKSVVRKSSETKARALVKRIQAKVDVAADLKKQLQITVAGEAPAPPVVPYPPKDLVANIAGSGSYELTWKRNGNIPSIIFVVEALIGDSADFVQVNALTKTNFTHSGNVPGTKIVYRVKALHGEVSSEYSNVAVVNEAGVAPPTA